MELQGNVKLILPLQKFDSGFIKRELILTTDEKFPQDVKIEFVKDKCEWLNAYKVGDRLTVHFNVRGNEYNGKYYTSIQGWKIEVADGAAAPAENTEQSNEEDDLPF